MTELAVELYGRRVGTLAETGPGTFDFQPSADAVDFWGIGSRILSYAVPLVARPRPREAPLRRNYFDEILPEGRARSRLAGNARIAPDYTIGMLARYGRDVAGAVKIWDKSAAGEPRQPALAPVSDERIREMLLEVASAPIGNSSVHRMSSLAGVQDKIVLARSDSGWAEPLDGYPSSHIIKPVVAEYPSLIFDEEYGARIAQALGLASFDTRVSTFDGVSALVIERYDRGAATPDGRIHQEDFNQVLGIAGDGKYESEGHPGLAAIANVVRRVDRDGLVKLLKMVTMSLAVGNLDLHAKNISILHFPDGSVRLAPAYDVVPQLQLGFDPKVALFINGKEVHGDISAVDLVEEGRAWGLRNAEEIVTATLSATRDFVLQEAPHPGAHYGLSEEIGGISSRLLAGGTSGFGSATGQSTSPTSPGGWGGPARR